jgi:hypothetical protein
MTLLRGGRTLYGQALGILMLDTQLPRPPGAVFPTVFIDNAPESDPAVLERELVELATGLVAEHPEVGAIVLECTNFVPYSGAMRLATGVPIFDLYTLVMQTYLATVGAEFQGFM